MAVNELDPDWINPEDDPLVGRLRALEWATVSSDLRERCWERISARLEELPADEQASRLRDVARYDFSRRQQPCREAVAQGWSRRPHLRALGGRSALALS